MNYSIACNILNLKPHFTHSELKKNYHILALQYHPDKNNNSKINLVLLNRIGNASIKNSYDQKKIKKFLYENLDNI